MSSVIRSEILDALALRVNFLTVDQVARTWFMDQIRPKDSARRALTRLIQDGLIAPKRLLNAFPEQPIEEPVFVWEVGDPKPDYDDLSKQLKDRWHGLAWTETQAFTITEKGAALIPGGGLPSLKAEDENHDLHMSAVFLVIRKLYPEWVRHWVAERQYELERPKEERKKFEKMPDAIVRVNGQQRIIDFGGAYDSHKVMSIHKWWSNRDTPYELW